MTEEKEEKDGVVETAAEGAAKSTATTLLPYAALAVGGYLLFKKYGDDVVSGVSGAAGGISETINTITETVSNTVTETVSNTVTETVNKTTKSVTTFIEDNTISKDEAADIEQEAAAFSVGSAPGVKLPKLDKESQKFISKYSDDKNKTRNFRESPYLNLGLGPETSPQKRSMLGLDEDGLKRINQVIKEGKLTQAGGLTHVNTNSKPRIVKNKYGMTNKEAQKQGLSPMAWRGNTNSSGGSSKNTNSSGGSSKNNLKKPKMGTIESHTIHYKPAPGGGIEFDSAGEDYEL